MLKHEKTAYLLTGKPGIGKSSAIKKIVNAVGSASCGGFYTEEIRVQGIRMGFRLVTLDGREGIMAYKGLAGPISVGSYGLDLACLDNLGVTAIYEALANQKLVIIDEIGPMEIYSERFKKAVLDALNRSTPLLGTIALRSHRWLDAVKQHKRVTIYELTLANRDNVVAEVKDALMSLKENTPRP